MSLIGRALISKPNLFFIYSATAVGLGGSALGVMLTLNPLTTPVGMAIGAPATLLLAAGVMDYVATEIAVEMDDDAYLRRNLIQRNLPSFFNHGGKKQQKQDEEPAPAAVASA